MRYPQSKLSSSPSIQGIARPLKLKSKDFHYETSSLLQTDWGVLRKMELCILVFAWILVDVCVLGVLARTNLHVRVLLVCTVGEAPTSQPAAAAVLAWGQDAWMHAVGVHRLAAIFA